MVHHSSDLDFDRIFSDLSIEPSTFDSLVLPEKIGVVSTSLIKIDLVSDVLSAIKETDFNVNSAPAPSGVNEQPLGIETIDGAMNRDGNIRLNNELSNMALFVIENGVFKVSRGNNGLIVPHRGLDIRTHGANLSTEYEPGAEYEDRAVVIVDIPGYPKIAGISPRDEAVLIPSDAIRAAYEDAGSFGLHTAGSKLAEMGIVRNKQDPHIDLTHGAFSRREQMARAILRTLTRLI